MMTTVMCGGLTETFEMLQKKTVSFAHSFVSVFFWTQLSLSLASVRCASAAATLTDRMTDHIP